MDTNETAGSRCKAIWLVLGLCEPFIMLLFLMWLRTAENFGFLHSLAAMACCLYGLYRGGPRRETATADAQQEDSRGGQNAAAANWPHDEHRETDDDEEWTTENENDEGQCREGSGGSEYSVEYSSDEEYSNTDSDDDSDTTVQFDGPVNDGVGVAVAA
ncbi:hypothetical protein CSOJ01_12675 [Colletotrichum sojae]|uniref:Uncharacterized protein n=1 Tax=Colletotrichum sojae TaxID=2175907 RepID=A0A8H6MLI1_9PEZI|nr:hypothetical protein CSOJ01_12675 [Colletotrichum sojae]